MATSKIQNQHGYPDGPTTEPDFLHVTTGLKSWLLTLDHKRIGMMYLFGILFSLLGSDSESLAAGNKAFDTVLQKHAKRRFQALFSRNNDDVNRPRAAGIPMSRARTVSPRLTSLTERPYRVPSEYGPRDSRRYTHDRFAAHRLR